MQPTIKSYIKVLGLVNGLSIGSVVWDNKYLLYGAIAIATLSLLLKAVVYCIDLTLEKFLDVLGMITNFIILSIVYIVIILPLSLLFQLRSKKQESRTDGAFTVVERNFTAEKFEKQW